VENQVFARFQVILWALVCLWSASAFGQRVLYVNADAVGAANGSSWDDAFADLQDALTVAQAGGEIWVAAGVYNPDRGTGDRTISFELVCGTAIYGGFAGREECLDERDWVANQTILSGDLNGDDGPRDCELVSDCCREHEGAGCDDPECEALVCASQPHCCNPLLPYLWDESCQANAQDACCHLGSWHACENSFMSPNRWNAINPYYSTD